ncbi:MAG: energy transducer TonB [Candidatus Palauibacterales bacterium]|nr:energy transducer TonB [Candidatus Palauibacterales bacterium]
MLTRREIRREERRLEPIHDRFKRHYSNALLLGMLASVGVHFAVFNENPAFGIVGLEPADEELAVVHLPPEVRIPPPPTAVARPATPRISDEPISQQITIAPTTFAENPVDQLPPPPREKAPDVRDHPVYIARDVEPRLLNGPEIGELLRRTYPPQLRDAGIEGEVLLWVYVESDGSPGVCQVHQSSGYAPLDRVAEEVARKMRFSPATCRDRPVGVWIAQPIQFRVRG